MSTLYDSIQIEVKNWWLSLPLGILFILVGTWIWRTPLESYVTLTMLFSIFISGIFNIAFSISNKKNIRGYGWHLAGGLLDLIIAFLLITHPAVTMAFLPFYVGFWLLFSGVLAIGSSFQIKSFGAPIWGWLLVFGIGTLLFSFLLLANPVFTSLSIVYMTALSFIAIGVFRVFFAFGLKKIHKEIKDI